MMSGLSLHKKLEENMGLLIFGILFVSAIGGLVQVLPSIFQESLKTPGENTKPYAAVELAGRDIYIREACGVCHTQQVRPLLAEIKRYGPYTRAGETVYDRPFLWGTKRTGPDLQRVGGSAANADDDIQLKMRVLRRLGHPYTDDEIEAAPGTLEGLMEIDALIAYLQVLGTSRSQGDTP
jgi:cytochrome c oxidase cbb3-type subunit 2